MAPLGPRGAAAALAVGAAAIRVAATGFEDAPQSLADLFRGEEAAREFLGGAWQRTWRRWPGGDAGGQRFRELFSSEEMGYAVEARPWRYGTDIKAVKEGNMLFEELAGKTMRPAHMQSAVEQGATLILNSVQGASSFKLAKLCSALERDLVGAWVSSNAYFTPPGTQGFSPHLDRTDSLILQVEGTKLWSMCDRFDTPVYYGEEKGRQRGKYWTDAEGLAKKTCVVVAMEPGDVMYIPYGTWHAATSAEGSEASLHLTITIHRPDFTWGAFLEPLLGGIDDESKARKQAAMAIREAAANKPKFASMLPPVLDELFTSLDDEDLPDGFLNRLREAARGLVTGEETALDLPAKLSKQLKAAIASGGIEVWQPALQEFRQKKVLGSLLPPGQLCLGASGWPLTPKEALLEALAGRRFRRPPSLNALLIELEPGQWTLGLDTRRLSLPGPAFARGARFALGRTDPTTSRGQPFALQQLAEAMRAGAPSAQAAVEAAAQLVVKLMQHCGLEEVAAPGDGGGTPAAAQRHEL